MAWRNNTWSVHVHVGVRGGDRAVAVSDAMRTYLPHLLALSANSPFIENIWTELASARVQTFVRMFPRCGVPDVFGDWSEHRRFVGELLADQLHPRVHADLVERASAPQVRHRRGAHLRRADGALAEPGRRGAGRTRSWPALLRRYDEGEPLLVLPTRYVEENLWRAIRYGLDGKLVAWPELREVPAPDAVRALVELAAPEAERLGCAQHLAGVERLLEEGNGTQRQVRAYHEGKSLVDVYRETVLRAHADAGVPVATSELGV